MLIVGSGDFDYRSLPKPAAAATAAAAAAAAQLPGGGGVLAARARGRLYVDDAALTAAWGRPAERELEHHLAPEITLELPVAFGRSLRVRARGGDGAGASAGGGGGGGGTGGGGGGGAGRGSGAYCAAYCSFDELCGPRPGKAALGAADYLALAAAVAACSPTPRRTPCLGLVSLAVTLLSPPPSTSHPPTPTPTPTITLAPGLTPTRPWPHHHPHPWPRQADVLYLRGLPRLDTRKRDEVHRLATQPHASTVYHPHIHHGVHTS